MNPIVAPRETTTFSDPLSGQPVAWEANDTFNPGATAYRGRVALLYRAENRSGVGIGGRTSRLGLAESRDGLHFARRATPVLFPAAFERSGQYV